MSDLITIRDFSVGDEAGLQECFIELQDFERSIEPFRLSGIAIAKSYVGSLFELCKKKSGKIFVATSLCEIVGFVCVLSKSEFDLELNGPVEAAYITDLIVKQAHRRKGIGERLMQAAELFAKESGAQLISIDVLARNVSARSFYTASGCEDYQLTLRKSLTESIAVD